MGCLWLVLLKPNTGGEGEDSKTAKEYTALHKALVVHSFHDSGMVFIIGAVNQTFEFRSEQWNSHVFWLIASHSKDDCT